jgi:cyclophilin family peptidyl-prolyl cis-trans isomerase
MTKKLIYILAFLTVLVFSCKKKKEPDPAPEAPKEEIVQISTDYGIMYVWLYKATPLHRENFLKWSRDTFYNNTTFHRVISGFMIQGGDFNSKDADTTNDGFGDPGYTIPAEIRDTIIHERGALGAARTNNPLKASSGTQFYICHSTSGTAHLNNSYTVFGMVMKGQEVIDSIVRQPKNMTNDRPFKDIRMQVKVLKKTLAEIKSEYNYIPKY